jgi:oligopeptide transport system substrate-binding protein
MAADVPAGVQLADKQTLVRNNGSEVQSLDPHKIEGVPESNINRDLFEGLLVSDVDGHPVPGVAEKWDNKDFKVWTFHLRKDANGPTARRLRHKISFIAGSVWRIRKPRLLMPAICNMAIANVDDIIAGKKPRPIWA